MRVLVTGSHGLIGTALVDALRRRGDDVTPLVRPAGWDPAAGTIDRDAIAGHDAVVHLAGENLGERRWTDAQKDRIMSSRREGTSLLCGALAALPADARPSVLVSGSAIGYFGDRGDELLTESSPSGGGFLAEVARAWEAATAPAVASSSGMRVVHLRTGIVLSSRGGALARQLLPFRLGLGGPLGGGRQWWSWVSLDDEVRAIVHCLDTPSVSGPVNVVAPAPVRQREFASTLGRVLHRPALVPTPLLPLRLVYGRQLVSEVLLGSQRVAPDALVSSGFSFSHGVLEEALHAVGV